MNLELIITIMSSVFVLVVTVVSCTWKLCTKLNEFVTQECYRYRKNCRTQGEL